MQGVWQPGVPIGTSKINSNLIQGYRGKDNRIEKVSSTNPLPKMHLTKTDVTHSEVNLAASHDEIQKCILLYDLKK